MANQTAMQQLKEQLLEELKTLQNTAVENGLERIKITSQISVIQKIINKIDATLLDIEREQIEQAYGDGLNAHRTDFCDRIEYYNRTFNTEVE
jgi:hypothetical protein